MDNSFRPSHLRLAAIIGALAIASTSLAQGVTGSALTGTVTDNEGKALPDAVVELRNESTGAEFVAVTDSSGEYLFDNVPPGGPYSLTVSADGYYGSKRTGMLLVLGNRLRLNAQIRKFEEMGEEVTVVAQVDELADRGRTGPSKTLSSAEMIDLPVQGRNFTDLISTAPQVSGTSMAGQNNRFNNIQIDGASYNDLFGLSGSGTPGGQAGAKALSIEAIESFVVQVSPFDVRYGNFAGGMVNAITKSGTNDFRGSVFGYWQNKELAGFQDDPTFLGYNSWQYGLSLGGPIIKDKVHFFVTADLQTRSSAFGNASQIGGVDAEADAARAGFTNAEAERFASILANTYGVQNAGNALAPRLRNPDRNVFAKLSTSAIPGSYLEVSYSLVNALQDSLTRAPTSPGIPGRLRDGYQLSNSGYAQNTTSHTARVKLVSTWLNGKLSNELLTGFSLFRDERDPGLDIPLVLVRAGQLGTAPAWLAAGSERFSQFNVLNQDVFQLQDSLTYKLGDHAITLGTSNEYLKIRNAFLQAATGVWAFDSLDDFEAGNASAFQRRFGVSDIQEPGTADFSVFQAGLYLQDSWTPFKGLTVTPGVRFDVPFLSDANVNERLVNNEALPINTGEVPSGNILWSPRLGVNWDVDGGTTIVRGGTGIFSGRPPYVWVSNAYSINGLSQVELTCQRNAGNRQVPAFTLDPNAQPFACDGSTTPPTAPVNQGEIDYFDKNTKYPQNFRVALGADRRLPLDFVGTVDLLYTRDINGWYTTDENLVRQEDSGEGRALYGTFAPTGNYRATPTRVDGANLVQAVKVFNKNGASVLSGTVQLRRDIANVVDATLAYTYTRSRDRISMTSSQALSNFQFAPLDGTIQDRFLRPGAFDRTHRITLTATATLPMGFNAGLIYVGQSGLPYTWTVSGDVNADGIGGNDLAFIPANADQITLQDPSQYEALSNFIQSQPCLRDSRGGFVQRGACRNPWQNILDMRLGWNAPEFIKGQHLELQMDILNVLNLINNDWGLFRQEASFENHSAQFLRAVGYDVANNRPVYSFTEPSEVQSVVYSPTRSRWRIQVGARYVF